MVAKTRMSRKEQWEASCWQYALERRNWLVKARRSLPMMLERVQLHLSGGQEMTNEGYREHREWLMHYFSTEVAQELGATQNLPHLTLVEVE